MPTSLLYTEDQHEKSHECIIAASLLAAFALLFFWLGSNGARPVSDAGGYVNMLRHFLESGEVDYMRWSQPTFIGVVALAAPWSLLFGTDTVSLQCLVILYGLATVGGLFIFLVQDVRPTRAALLCVCLLCFSEFLPNVPAFMTDIPYIAYIVWFLIMHRALETKYNDSQAPSVSLWAIWGGLFLLAALTRSFALVLVPLFGLQWLLAMRLPTDHALKPNAALPGIIFRRRCFFVSLALAAVSVLVVKILGRNAIPLSEITVIPEVLKEQRWARFDLRALCIISVQTVLMLLPALLLFASGQRGDRQRAIHPGELAVGLGMTVVAVYFWKKSLLPPLFFVPFRPASGAFIGMLQLIPVPFAGVLTARLLRSSLSARMASGEISTLSSTLQVLFVIIVSNVLVLPVLQHPVLRHSLPAFVAAVMAVGLVSARGLRTDLSSTSEYSNRGEKPLVLLALCGVMLLGSMNVIGAYSTRQMTAAQWDMAESLRRQGVPAAQIEGGWAWFCVHHLQPALPQNESYVTRFKRLEDTAAYRVTYASQSNSALRPNERVLSKVVVASAYGPQTLRTLKRGEALPAQ